MGVYKIDAARAQQPACFGDGMDARDMAVARASLGKVPIVLSSATPSIESHVNARTGRYAYVALPGRYSGTDLPDVSAIDMRSNPPDKGRWLAPPLVEAADGPVTAPHAGASVDPSSSSRARNRPSQPVNDTSWLPASAACRGSLTSPSRPAGGSTRSSEMRISMQPGWPPPAVRTSAGWRMSHPPRNPTLGP